MLLCQELIFLIRHFKQDAAVDVAVVIVNNSQQFVGILTPNLFRYSYVVSRNVLANLVFESHLAILGPFIRGKIRRVLNKTQTFRINGTFRLK